MTEEKMLNMLVAFLTCLCCALLLLVGYQYEQYSEARDTISKQETQLKELYAQVNEIWAEYMGMMKRIQQHG